MCITKEPSGCFTDHRKSSSLSLETEHSRGKEKRRDEHVKQVARASNKDDMQKRYRYRERIHRNTRKGGKMGRGEVRKWGKKRDRYRQMAGERVNQHTQKIQVVQYLS